jgi:hypothetical protein
MSMSPQTWRLLLALMGGVVLPGGEMPTPVPQQELLLASPRDGLSSNYALSVVAVPEPPAALMPEPCKWGHSSLGDNSECPQCPFEVRAIVLAERKRDSFAMLARGEDSKLAHVGEKIRGFGAEFVIEELQPRTVVLRQGEALVECDLEKR